MQTYLLYVIWAVLYVLCAALGFLPSPEGAVYGLCVFASVLFFLPPGLVLYRAKQTGDRREPKRIRAIALIMLVVSCVMIILNILSVIASELTGRVLYSLMVVLTAPMVAGQWWIIGLFGWACLLVVSIKQLRDKASPSKKG